MIDIKIEYRDNDTGIVEKVFRWIHGDDVEIQLEWHGAKRADTKDRWNGSID